jgi:hypothetical protein
MTGLDRGDVVLVVCSDNLATSLDKAIAGELGRLHDMGGVDAAMRRTLAL